MTFTDHFDAVVMLTWSDWKNEPRSNRYHYATRFAAYVPVLFVQPWAPSGSLLTVEPTEIPGIDIVHVCSEFPQSEVNSFIKLLKARGIRRPLVWIYNSIHFQPLIKGLPRAFRVYHATEDYLTETLGWNQGMEQTARSVISTLRNVDFMVACTQKVAETYLTKGGYTKPYIVVENGCDAEYFIEHAQQMEGLVPQTERPVAIFQGGINQRIDYNLLLGLIKRMPDWQFRFCGAAVESDGWKEVLKQPNVIYFGALAPDEFTQQMLESTVGIIPYIQDQWIRNSLPLKAYEYVACGLPVVTVPIEALLRDAEILVPATTAEEFERAIRKLAPTRHDPNLLELRRTVALDNSYNKRFQMMEKHLLTAHNAARQGQRTLRVAVFYDSIDFIQSSIARENLNSFKKYSRHDITYIPATTDYWNSSPEKLLNCLDLSAFDVAIIHFSVKLSLENHLAEGIALALDNFHGLKVLFAANEYERTETLRSWMDRLNFDLVYTNASDGDLVDLYPSYRYPATEFLPNWDNYINTLTDCAYRDIILSDNYPHQSFVHRVDAALDNRVLQVHNQDILSITLSYSPDGTIRPILPALQVGIAQGSNPLGSPKSLEDICLLVPGFLSALVSAHTTSTLSTVASSQAIPTKRLVYLLLQNIWRTLPLRLRGALRPTKDISFRIWRALKKGTLAHALKCRIWKLLPQSIQTQLKRVLLRN